MTDYDMSIHQNPDAQAWAKFFIETTKDMDRDAFRDEEYMIGWFANAMMAMHDHLLGIRFHNGDHIEYEMNEFLKKQERLGEEFEKVLYENLDELYVTDKDK
jgi:hypothetical protein